MLASNRFYWPGVTLEITAERILIGKNGLGQKGGTPKSQHELVSPSRVVSLILHCSALGGWGDSSKNECWIKGLNITSVVCLPLPNSRAKTERAERNAPYHSIGTQPNSRGPPN